MFCPRWDKAIFRWLNGRLDRAGQDRLMRHMGACDRCQETAAQFGRVRDILGKAQAPEVPESLSRTIEDRVRARIRAGETSADPIFPPRTRIAPAFACMFAGVAIGAVVGWTLIESSMEGRADRPMDWVAVTGIERVSVDPVAEILWPLNGRGNGQ